jgi:hypothetical protein
MEKLIERLKRWRMIAEDAEQVYERVKDKNAPALIALPLLYKHLEQQGIGDRRLLSFVGQYLTTQYPELAEYFVSARQREDIVEFRKTLDRILEEQHGSS